MSSNFDWRDHLSDEYGDEPEVVGSEQSDFKTEGKIPVVIGDATFYVRVPEKWAGDLGLLTQSSLTGAERFKLNELLRILKTRRDVRGGDGQNHRREFLSALREREAIAANRLRQEQNKPSVRLGEK